MEKLKEEIAQWIDENAMPTGSYEDTFKEWQAISAVQLLTLFQDWLEAELDDVKKHFEARFKKVR